MKKHYRGVPKKVRDAVWLRSGGQCEGIVSRYKENGMYYAEKIGVCGNPAEQLAHIQPKGIGGSKLLDYEGNLIYLCLQ
jgi:hypothetical protein